MHNMLFDVSELVSLADASNFLGVSMDTIRRWEKKGLVKGRRSSKGHRFFHMDELSRLQDKLSGTSGGNYQILIAERKSRYSVIELFAGAGGLALGMENAGLKAQLLVELDTNAVATLRLNRPSWNVVGGDVAQVNFKGMSSDILTGGFPCQAFSYAGKKMGFDDTRGTLFFEYARAVKETRPKIIVGENVRGLLKHDGGRTLSTMLGVLGDLGYRVEHRILRTQYLDVPQKRERLVIIGVRSDLSLPIAFPQEKNYTVSLRDALQAVPESIGQKYTQRKHAVMSMIPPGGYWRDLPKAVQKDYMGGSFHLSGGKTGMARRLSWDEPSLTLTCNPAQKQTERCHPSETRPLNVREYARIQTFPDSWTFSGSVAAQYKQIGNAVPVNLGYHIGRCLIGMLNGELDEKSTHFLKRHDLEPEPRRHLFHRAKI